MDHVCESPCVLSLYPKWLGLGHRCWLGTLSNPRIMLILSVQERDLLAMSLIMGGSLDEIRKNGLLQCCWSHRIEVKDTGLKLDSFYLSPFY